LTPDGAAAGGAPAKPAAPGPVSINCGCVSARRRNNEIGFHMAEDSVF